jgi:hypothetical protein
MGKLALLSKMWDEQHDFEGGKLVKLVQYFRR